MKYIKRDGPKSNFGTAGYTEGAPKKMFDIYNRLQPRNKKKVDFNAKLEALKKSMKPRVDKAKPIKEKTPINFKEKKKVPVPKKRDDYFPGGDRTEGVIPPHNFRK